MKALFILSCFCFFMYCISESLGKASKDCGQEVGYEFVKPIGRNQPWQCVRKEN